jgi:hypothetical protein
VISRVLGHVNTMKLAMSDKAEATVLGSLPHSRPQRRSAKRAARPKQPAEPETPRADPEPEPEQPEPEQLGRPRCPPSVADGAQLLGTVVEAGVELAEIGLTVAAHTLRIAVSRLPKP